MIDVEALRSRWIDGELAAWARRIDEQVESGLSEERYGDLPRWRAALAALPEIDIVATHLDRGRVSADAGAPLDEERTAQLETALRGLHPWRKGPFEFCGLHIDTE
ncbi:MAG: DUF1698 domain-containing protein, partial [Halieaceae bacterium]|nr:DUF1698 domain-containing protein [Halieaceae bacterium]